MPDSKALSRLRRSAGEVAFSSDTVRDLFHLRQITRWKKAGMPIPPPTGVKHKIVRSYASASGATTFIETGTLYGDMDFALRNQFKALYSIELSEPLWQRATRRLRGFPHIRILHGDSGELLPAILEELRDPAVFWLDGHFSGAFTARGDQDTPVVKELTAILGHRIRDHVVLIDDARHFNGVGDYPTLKELEELVVSHRPGLRFTVANDVIRIHRQERIASEF